MRKTELLIPAGSLDVLKTAVVYGADAVYIGGEAFGLRAKAARSAVWQSVLTRTLDRSLIDEQNPCTGT